jgi:hypothetical protein
MIKRDDKGRVESGSKLHQVHDLDSLITIFDRLADACIAGEYLSIQECQMHSGLKPSNFYDVAAKYPELEDSKRQMNDAIIANINRLGLTGKYNPTVCIWRFKNLGEKDKSEVEISTKEQPLFNLD